MRQKFTDSQFLFVVGTLGKGGAEKQLFYIMRALLELGIQPTLASFTTGEYWEEQIAKLKVPVIFIGQTYSKFERALKLTKLARKNNFDIIQSQHFYTNFYVGLAGKLSGTTSLGAIRGDLVFELGETGFLAGRLCLRLPSFLAANSKAGIRNAVDRNVAHHRLLYLPNVIDCEQYSPIFSESSTSNVVLLIVSNLQIAQKRVDLFIQVVCELFKKGYMNVRGFIVGDGHLRSELESRVKKLRLPHESVQFLGRRDDLPMIYRNCDILIHTSEHEGTPNVIMEAMASGLPVVASRVGGIPDLIQDGKTGYLVDSGDLEGFVHKVALLIDDPTKMSIMGEEGRKFIASNYSLELLPEKLCSFYSSILG